MLIKKVREVMNGMSVIDVKNLTKIFGRHQRQAQRLLDEGKSKADILKETGCTVGVNQTTFSVEKGETFVIMGLSGSGKSTLVRMLNRLIEATSGDVFLEDENITDMNKEQLRKMRRKKMSM